MQIRNELTKLENTIKVKEEESKTLGTSWFYKALRQLIRPISKQPLVPSSNLPAQIDVHKQINLDDKVDEYIGWYKEKIKGHYTDIGEYQEPKRMRDFIEKMASWYELRYPEYEVNRLLSGSNQEPTHINDVMFKNNPYVKELLGCDTDIECLDWCDFYNFEAFFNSLPEDEKEYLRIDKYPGIVYYDSTAHFHLTPDGYVNECEDIPFLDGNVDDASNQYHITDIWSYMLSTKMKIPEKCEIGKVIASHYDDIKRVNNMLDVIMYRIIERGGNRIGPRRAFLFAREFGRDISIPLIYGVDTSDPGMRQFMNAYFKAGGSKDITCYINYFSRASKNEQLNTISMRELLRTTPNDCIDFYTPEEKENMVKLTSILDYVAKEKGTKYIKYLKVVNGLQNRE